MDIKITLPQLPCDGKLITVRTPCDCTNVTGLLINDTLTLTIKNADGSPLASKGHFTRGVLISGIADVTNNSFYLLNDAYIGATKVNYDVEVPLNWTEDAVNGGFYQIIALQGLLETDRPFVDVVLGADMEANDTYETSWGNVKRVVAGADTLTLYAKEAPEVAFTMQIEVVR